MVHFIVLLFNNAEAKRYTFDQGGSTKVRLHAWMSQGNFRVLQEQPRRKEDKRTQIIAVEQPCGMCSVHPCFIFAARKLVKDGGRSQDGEGMLFSHVKKKKNKTGQEVIVYQSTSDPILKMLKTCAFRGTLGVYSLRKCGNTLLADNGFQRDAIN